MVEANEPWAVSVEGDCPVLVMESIQEYAVTVDPGPDVLVVTVGEQGPPGKPGEGAAEWTLKQW